MKRKSYQKSTKWASKSIQLTRCVNQKRKILHGHLEKILRQQKKDLAFQAPLRWIKLETQKVGKSQLSTTTAKMKILNYLEPPIITPKMMWKIVYPTSKESVKLRNSKVYAARIAAQRMLILTDAIFDWKSYDMTIFISFKSNNRLNTFLSGFWPYISRILIFN